MALAPEPSAGSSNRPVPTPQPGPAPTPVSTKKPAPKKKPSTKTSPKTAASVPVASSGLPGFGSQGVIDAQHPDASAKNAVYSAIERAAAQTGVPLALALAIAQQESGFNTHSVGDNGSSFGLFQLHRGGELGSMTPQQAFDPYTNALRALTQVAATLKTNPGMSWGQVAAAAQRPADKIGYASSVDGILRTANNNPDYFIARIAKTPASPVQAMPGGPAGNVGIAAFDPNATVSIDAYGYVHDLAKNEPDLAALMQKYAGQDLTSSAVQQRLQADIQSTKWWRSHSATQRAAEIQKYQDPGTYQRSIDAQVTGVSQAADSYLIPMDQHTARVWASRLASGLVTADDYTNYLKEQAKSLFPGMGAAIDSGVTPETYVQPYKQIAASTLEIPPEQVNFLSPKWSKALFQTDPKTGARTSMSLADWQDTLRTNPIYGYDKTDQARTAAADLTTQLGHSFGAL